VSLKEKEDYEGDLCRGKKLSAHYWDPFLGTYRLRTREAFKGGGGGGGGVASE